MRENTSFGYQISKTEAGWSWVTFAPGGAVGERGTAPDKALAAACVIRALARSALHPDMLRAAA